MTQLIVSLLLFGGLTAISVFLQGQLLNDKESPLILRWGIVLTFILLGICFHEVILEYKADNSTIVITGAWEQVCPQCKVENKSSTSVRQSLKVSNSGAENNSVDSIGRLHRHPDQKFTSKYVCTNGHTFTLIEYANCPSCSYKRGTDIVEYRVSVRLKGAEK